MEEPLADRAARVAFAFEGTQVSRNVIDEVADNGAVLTFDVDLVYKGAVSETISVLTNAQGGACGVDYGRLGRVGVTVYEWRGEPSVNLCGSLVSVEELTAVFGDGAPPMPSPVQQTRRLPSTPVLAAAGIGFVVLLLGAAVSGKMLSRSET